MPLVVPTVTNTLAQSQGDGSIILWTWILTTANPIGLPIGIPEWSDRTWSFLDGASDVAGAATCNIIGANSIQNLSAVNNGNRLNNAAGGAPIIVTAIGTATVIENPLYMAPALSVPGTAAVWTINLLIRRPAAIRQ